jgi:regulatory protein
MLSRKGFMPGDIQACIEKLEEWGYLNDRVLARDILRAIIRNTPCGKRRCFYELEKRRFCKELIEDLVQEVYSGLDELCLAHTAAKQYAKGKSPWTLKDSERLARWLYRRGFTGETILSVVRTFGPAGDVG